MLCVELAPQEEVIIYRRGEEIIDTTDKCRAL